MAYDIQLADRVRIYLAEVPRIKVQEKSMFRGLAFLVNGKMCVNVSGENLMCRIDPEIYEEALERRGCREMTFTGRPMPGYVLVDETGMANRKDFEYWIGLCLDFNKRAKSSKKKKA